MFSSQLPCQVSCLSKASHSIVIQDVTGYFVDIVATWWRVWRTRLVFFVTLSLSKRGRHFGSFSFYPFFTGCLTCCMFYFFGYVQTESDQWDSRRSLTGRRRSPMRISTIPPPSNLFQSTFVACRALNCTFFCAAEREIALPDLCTVLVSLIFVVCSLPSPSLSLYLSLSPDFFHSPGASHQYTAESFSAFTISTPLSRFLSTRSIGERKLDQTSWGDEFFGCLNETNNNRSLGPCRRWLKRSFGVFVAELAKPVYTDAKQALWLVERVLLAATIEMAVPRV